MVPVSVLDIDIDIVELELHTRTGLENELENLKILSKLMLPTLSSGCTLAEFPLRLNGRRFRLCKDCGVHEARHTCTGKHFRYHREDIWLSSL